jgi:uncharacterized protein (TIGR03435 family)
VTRTRSLLSLVLGMSWTVAAQSFEVASIKLHADLVRSVGVSISGARVTVSAMTLTNLVDYAYDVKFYQVSGGPNWAHSDRWDISAKGEGDRILTRDEVRKMVQVLLADRFQVRLHRETREAAVYALVVAGKGGPKLKESAPDANSILHMGGTRTTRITTTKGSMDQLVTQLSAILDRPVLNKTGLTESYDYKLEWAPEGVAAGSDAPSIFTALQEQLGLKLESTKGPIETVVIDRAERPSAN